MIHILNYLLVSNILFFLTTSSEVFPVQPMIMSPLPMTGNSKQVIVKNTSQTFTPTPTPVTSRTDKDNDKDNDSSANKNTENDKTSNSQDKVAAHTTDSDSDHDQPTPTPTVAQNTPINQSVDSTDTTSDSLTPTPTAPYTISATSTIKSNGKIINLAMKYQSNGGTISGTMSGDCNGTISGNYSGPATGNLAGSADVKCTQGFLNVPVNITYKGKMAANDKQVTITYTVNALGQKEQGTSTLQLSQ